MSESGAGTIALDLGISALLLCISAVLSGLTLGLLTLDVQGLEIIISANSPDAVYAKKILPIRRRGNWLLCTLLLVNTACNSGLSVLLDGVTGSGFAAVASSTILVMIFAEVIPQATFSRHALRVGAFFTPFVNVLMYVCSPISYPIAWLLDKVLGKELGLVYNKQELKQLVELHRNTRHHGHLARDEVDIMHGALEFSEKTVGEIMTPVDKCFVVDVNQKLTIELLTDVFRAGYSRIPCIDRRADGRDVVVGVLHVKDLILVDPDDEIPISTVLNVYGRSAHCVFPETKLNEMLVTFRSGRVSHLAVVRDVVNDGPGDPFYKTLGVVTLEDVIEEIIKNEILDERDALAQEEGDEKQGYSPKKLYQADISRLNIFNKRIKNLEAETNDGFLTVEEAAAIYHHLTGTVKEFFVPTVFTRANLSELISSCRVISIEKPDQSKNRAQRLDIFLEEEEKGKELIGLNVVDGGWSFFGRDKPAECAYLILSGKIEVLAGRSGYKSVCNRWSFVGLEALQTIDMRAYEQDREDELKSNATPTSQTQDNDTLSVEVAPLNANVQVTLEGSTLRIPFPTFLPDFSAHALSSVRALRITRQDYARYCYASKVKS